MQKSTSLSVRDIPSQPGGRRDRYFSIGRKLTLVTNRYFSIKLSPVTERYFSIERKLTLVRDRYFSIGRN